MRRTFKRLAVLLIADVVFIAIVIAVYAIGYEYDRDYKLYPESVLVSYDVSMQVYGQRWERLAKFLLTVGGVANFVILLSWYRESQKRSKVSIVET